MLREHVILTIYVEVELDPIPGTFHTRKSAQEVVENIVEQTLRQRIPHYLPKVQH